MVSIGKWVEMEYAGRTERGFVLNESYRGVRVAFPNLKRSFFVQKERLRDIEETQLTLEDFDLMIDLALDTKDQVWFQELAYARKALLNQLNK
ncbi:hypothetical protein CHL76_02345 [Marinococcus halophilus]|nr:hypothetical protein CHL76_02345 [Marinococcus halophilus]